MRGLLGETRLENARKLRVLIALAGLIALAFGVGLYARARVAAERAAAAPAPIVDRASAETASRELAAQPALAPAALPAPVATPVSESADKAASAQVPVPVHEAAREPGHRKPASAPGSRTAAHSADARTRPGKAALHEAWPESSRPKPRLNLDSM